MCGGGGRCGPGAGPAGAGEAEGRGGVEGSAERSWGRGTVPVVGGESPLAKGVAPE